MNAAAEAAGPRSHKPELGKYMEKRVSVKLNAGRLVTGRLRGFDVFMNLVLDEAVEEASGGGHAAGEKKDIGTVVRAAARVGHTGCGIEGQLGWALRWRA
jgi:small nuclear ribonucleoprotein G